MKRSATSGSWLVVFSDMGILSGSGKAGAGRAGGASSAGGAGNAGGAGSAGHMGGAGNACNAGGTGRSRQPWMLYAFTVPQLKTN